MSDMRLIVAGAGGAVGRTVIKASPKQIGSRWQRSRGAPRRDRMRRANWQASAATHRGEPEQRRCSPMRWPDRFYGSGRHAGADRKSTAHGLATSSDHRFTAAHENAIAAAAVRARIVSPATLAWRQSLGRAGEQVARTLMRVRHRDFRDAPTNKKLDAPQAPVVAGAAGLRAAGVDLAGHQPVRDGHTGAARRATSAFKPAWLTGRG